jgi:putrescine transport system permease protein
MTEAGRRRAVLALPVLWMGAFFVAPFAIVLAISFAEVAEGLPPFAWPEGGPSGANYAMLFADGYYLDAYLRSLRVAAVAAVLCLLLGYPMALAIARAPARWRGALLLAVMLPFWTSFLLRVTAWIGVLGDGGWLNSALLAAGLTGEPVALLYTEGAMYLGLVHGYLPFMVLPLFATLVRQERVLEEAAADLGAAPWRVFLTVTLPLSLPGVVAGMLLVFIPVAGEFLIPELLGGPGAQLVGRVLWTEFFQNRDWPLASALAVVLLAALVVPIAVFQARVAR